MLFGISLEIVQILTCIYDGLEDARIVDKSRFKGVWINGIALYCELQ